MSKLEKHVRAGALGEQIPIGGVAHLDELFRVVVMAAIEPPFFNASAATFISSA
ncbi:MAG: hypothetical protein SGI86_18135 [Deltaproteobacteria bacterium]|nr:hypothetical protein [Deltaproteobacteria bacterium]